MRLFLATFSVFLCLIFPPCAHAFTAHAENLGTVQSHREEGLQLLKLSRESFLADRIHYALIDKEGLALAVTPEVSRYTHKLDCDRPHVCLVYDVWHLNPAEWKIWDLEYGLDSEERKDFFPSHGKAEWMDFISSRNTGKFESLTLKDIAEKPFGTSPVDAGKHLQAQFFAACILTILMLLTAYAAARAWHKKHLLLQTASVMIYGLSFIFACFLIDIAFTIPPLHFCTLMLASIFCFYRLHNRARRLASQA